jgi:hypothetical protein
VTPTLDGRGMPNPKGRGPSVGRGLLVFARAARRQFAVGRAAEAVGHGPRVDPLSPRFLHQVETGNVTEISVQSAMIQGTFRHAVAYPRRRASATPAIPVSTDVRELANNDQLSQLLIANGVTIGAHPPNSGSLLVNLLLGFGPTLLIIGAFVLLARGASRMAKDGTLGAFGRSSARRPKETDVGVTSPTCRDRRGQGRALRGRGLPAQPQSLHTPWRARPARRAPDRATRHRDDAAGAGSRRGGARRVLLGLGLRVRGGSRGRRCRPGPRPVQAAEGRRPVDHLHRRTRRESIAPEPTRRPSAAPTTSASRR